MLQRRAIVLRQPNTVFIQTLLDKIKKSMPVAVIHGGDRRVEGAVIHQTRNPRSDKTYLAVASDIANALSRLGFHQVDLVPEDMRMADKLRKLNTGIAWLNTGGTQGFASICHASSIMEMIGVPYIGHDPLNAALMDNKHSFKYSLNGLGIATPEFVVCNFKDLDMIEKIFDRFDQVFGGAEYFVVKPVSGRASLHVHRVHGKQEAREVAKQVHDATGNLVLIERFMTGIEYTIAVNGPYIARGRVLERLDGPFTFSAIRRVMAKDEHIFTSMDVRPIGLDRCQILDPVADEEIVASLSKIAERVYRGFGLETMVRVDIRADSDGSLFVLEVNPKPDLKQPSQSGFSFVSAGLGHHGMDYDDLILSIITDRIQFLITHRRDMIPKILDLV
jgi:D-alanine-D-alanine ligase